MLTSVSGEMLALTVIGVVEAAPKELASEIESFGSGTTAGAVWTIKCKLSTLSIKQSDIRPQPTEAIDRGIDIKIDNQSSYDAKADHIDVGIG